MGCDAWLAKQLAEGNPDAMDRLIHRHGERLRRTIGQLTAWGPDVDDLLQETLIRAWKYASHFRSDGSLEKWLVSIAYRVCRDHHRGVRRMLFNLQQFWKHVSIESGFDTKRETERSESEQWDRMQTAMQKLSPGDREILVMIHLEHWSHEELAEQLRLSVETLHVRLHRAKSRLKKWIDAS